MTGLLKSIGAHVASGRETAAIDDGQQAISWADAEEFVSRTVDELGALGRDRRPVGLILDHSPASALLLIAMIEADVPVIPLPPFFTAAQRTAALDDAGASRLVTACRIEAGRVRIDPQPHSAEPADLPAGTAVISFSSGSTGDPKGVCLSAAHLIAVATAVCDTLGRDMAGRHLPVLPFGILLEQVAGLFASIIAGGTYVPLAASRIGLADPVRPDPLAFLSAIERERATSLILVPEYFAVLVGAMEATGRTLPALNLVAVGGASISPGLLERARNLGLPVRQGYGMTETGSVIALERGDGPSIGSVGKSIGAHRLTLADDGEIIIDGPLFLGLVGKPRPPGPFATGDIGRLDEDGKLWIEGRKFNLLITSLGRNISPEWIEGLLVAQPEIVQALVRGDGEATLEALIVPAGPAADVRAAFERVTADLPDYARPSGFQLVPPFTPMNAMLTGNGRLRRAVIDQSYPRHPASATFFDRLVAETREEQARFAMTPQLIAGLTGQISRSDYIAYLGQAFHHVRHTVPLMMEARVALEQRGDRTLVEALDDYIVEETGHEEWILDDIAAAGGDRAVAASSDPSPATKAMVSHAYQVIRMENPAAFFGMVFVLEGTSIAMASDGAASVQKTLGLPPAAFRYLTSHGALDQDHMKFFEKLMNRIDDPDDQSAIIAMAKDIFRLFGGMFSAIELEGVRHAA